MVLESVRNPENPEETRVDTETTCDTPHKQQPELRIKLGTWSYEAPQKKKKKDYNFPFTNNKN